MAVHRNNGRVTLDGIEDVVAYIGANSVKVLASVRHPGHDVDTIAAVVLSDAFLDKIRAGYVRRVEGGMATDQAVKEVGVNLIAIYAEKAGFPIAA